MDEDELRDVLARLPAGVVLVSTRAANAFRGMTATSFSAVSLQPPLVLPRRTIYPRSPAMVSYAFVRPLPAAF